MVEVKVVGDDVIKTIKLLEAYQSEIEYKLKFYAKHKDYEVHEKHILQLKRQLKTVKELDDVYRNGMYDNTVDLINQYTMLE